MDGIRIYEVARSDIFENSPVMTSIGKMRFEVWKDEAFSLWLSEWATLYNEESRSSELIHEIHKTYYLVNVVDHDFINGDIFDIFETINTKYSETSSDTASVDIGR